MLQNLFYILATMRVDENWGAYLS